MDDTSLPKCPKRIMQGRHAQAIEGIWNEFVGAVTRHPEYTTPDLFQLGELCRLTAAMGDLWDKSIGNEAMFNARGSPVMNPATKVYLEFLTQQKQLCRQLGISLKDNQSLQRGQLAIRLLEQKIEGAQVDELGAFANTLDSYD